MSNHTGTLIRIVGIFLSLLIFWFMISIAVDILLSFIDVSLFSIINILYILGFILLIRVFYPKFIFRT